MDDIMRYIRNNVWAAFGQQADIESVGCDRLTVKFKGNYFNVGPYKPNVFVGISS